MWFFSLHPNLRGEGWVPGRLGQCPKFDRIFILMASLSKATSSTSEGKSSIWDSSFNSENPFSKRENASWWGYFFNQWGSLSNNQDTELRKSVLDSRNWIMMSPGFPGTSVSSERWFLKTDIGSGNLFPQFPCFLNSGKTVFSYRDSAYSIREAASSISKAVFSIK